MLSTFNPKIINIKKNFFQVKKIEITNTKILDERDLIKLFDVELKGFSILFIDNKKINNILSNNLFIERVELKKIYPNKIQIKIYEKEPIAIMNKKKGIFYLIKNGEEIKFFKSSKLRHLPNIFGKQKNFLKIHSSLKNVEFPISEIKSFYYFDIGRWDIIMKNNNIIKLPVENFKKSLENYMSIKTNLNFEKYKIFDYRIEDQLILN